MYIAQLNLKGFKSFGQTHSLPLSTGLTAIVGPNGSGKSNLLDGLRWALGEGNAGRLRITRQQDLIFQGSASIIPGAGAEVALKLQEGSRHTTICRKVSSDSGGYLFVDGNRIRLQDLDLIKRKWHLEGDRFAFIGQGEVTEVIQQRPMQRRAHLESLFGIDLYRKKRDEASQRMDTARVELERLLTLMAELRSRRVTIASGVRKALKAREIVSSLEEARRILYWLRRADLEERLRRTDRELHLLVQERSVREHWTGRWRNYSVILEKKVADLDEGNRKVQEEWDRKTEVLDDLRRRCFSLGTKIHTACEDLVSRRSRIVQEEEALGKVEEEVRDSGQRSESARVEREAAERELQGLQERWEEISGVVDATRRKREEILTRRARLGLMIQERASRCSFLGQRCLEVRKDLCRVDGELDNLRSSMSRIGDEILALDAHFQEVLDSHRQAYVTCQKLGTAVQQGRRDIKKATDRLEELREASEMEIYPRPVRYLLSASRLGRLHASPRALVDLFRCPERVTRAVESFLGGRQFWLAVETLDEAQKCIEELKKGQAGRATFLPQERAHPRRPGKTPSGGGIVGWARDILECDPFWQDVLDHVMGDLLILEDYRTGAGLVRQGVRFPLVTLEGDVFQPSGTVAGGARKQGPGALEVRRKVQIMESALAEKRREIEVLEEQVTSSEALEMKLGEEKEDIGARLRILREEVGSFEARDKVCSREREGLLLEKDRISQELGQQGRKWREGVMEQEKLALDLSDLPEAREEEGLSGQLMAARSRLAIAAERFRSAEEMDRRISRDRQDIERRHAALCREVDGLRQNAVSLHDQLRELGLHYHHTWNARQDLKGRFRDRDGLLAHLIAFKGQVQLRLERAIRRLEETSSMEERYRRQREGCLREKEGLLEQWEERFPYPGPGDLPDLDIEELRQEVREGERNLRKMGQVDMGVLSEDEALQGRLAFMEAQEKDVREGMGELEQLIRETDREAGKVFSGALRDIDKGFNALFVRLFGGGEARLELAEADSLWEAGVEVIARPPGKSPQNLRQLSGGEQSLTAIALLFASMEIAGVPLAVLDEVDAALDEVNLGRFADLAREYANRLQILVMTHRRLTMERADVMYGVTLSEPGLSQVVGVRLEEWD